MKLNLSKYSKQIKYLCVIPLFAGILSLSELIVPLKTIDSIVLSKDTTHKVKFGFDIYTRTVHFNNLREQFTEEIYNIADIGDNTSSEVTYLSNQIQEITFKKNNKKYINSNGENYAIIFMAIFMLLPTLAWRNNRRLNNKHSRYIIFIILFSLFYGLNLIL